MRRRAVVVGAGIGGLTAAAGLYQAGWDVTICERAPALAPVGAGLGIAPNGLRALDTIGAADAVRALATHQQLGIRRADGRWILRSSGPAIAARFGDPLVLLTRAALLDVLLGCVPGQALQLSAEVIAITPGGSGRPALVSTPAGVLEAELVVAADGIRSLARACAFPEHPGLRYTGFTTWRFLADPIDRPGPMSETWGTGSVFGVMPMADGRIYCYAAARAAAGGGSGDEAATLRRLFGGWHDPIPRLLRTATTEQVLRHDVEELARPLPAFHLGRIALAGDAAHPMAPNLGQGGCQALEDAVVLARLAGPADARRIPELLARYTSIRLARTTGIVRRSRRVAATSMVTFPAAIVVRNAAVMAAGRLAPRATWRGLTKVYDWHPPEWGARVG